MHCPRAIQRLTIGVLAIALLCSCKSELYARVSEREANEILATLYSAGIHATKRTGDEKTWAVYVADGDMQRALLLLSEHGLPHEHFSNTGDLFKKEGLISTPSEERIRYIYAVSQELSSTLSQIDGVIAARVHPVIPANDPLATRVRPASASIFIKHRADANLQALAPAIKNLVMRSIEGLGYENISLTFVAAEEPARERKPGKAGEGYTARTAAMSTGSFALLGAAITSLLFVFGGRVLRRRRGESSRDSPGAGPRRWRAWTDEVR
jgi:type III secretion protein J